MADNSYQPKVYRKQGGAEFVVASSGAVTVESGGSVNLQSGGTVAVASGAYIPVSSGGQIAVPVTMSTATDEGIPNFGMCTINSSGAAGDCRTVAAPTRAGLVLDLVANSGTTIGVNVCVASATSNVDITIESSGVSQSVWEIIGSTQSARFVSANTSQWFVVGPITGTLSTDGST